MRKLIIAATILALTPGLHPAAARDVSGPTLLIQASSPQNPRATTISAIELSAFALYLDVAWDYLAVAPHNQIARMLDNLARDGVPERGVSPADARSAIARGVTAAETLSKIIDKQSVEGRALAERLKKVFEN
jgi:hypothetical protein